MRKFPNSLHAPFTTFAAAALLGMAVLTPATPAEAYQVAPLHHYLDLTGKGATSSLSITNTHDYPLTVELTVQERTFKDGQKQDDIAADDDFLIFPPQAIIAPGKTQRVQVRYVGDPLEASRVYRLVVAQVPVNVSSGEKAAIDIAYNFVSAVYVAPKTAKPDVKVGAIAPSAKGGYDVQIRNDGNYHALLPSFVWTASDGTKTQVLDTSRVPLGDAPFIEPGGTRTVHVPATAMGDMGALSSLDIVAGKRG